MKVSTRSFMVFATGLLLVAATACSSAKKTADESDAATTPSPVVTETTTPAIEPAPVLAQNDSKTKGLWGASSTGRSH